MAYNIQPLIQLLTQILDPGCPQHWLLHLNDKPITLLQSLLEKADVLIKTFENLSPTSNKTTERLEREITETTYKARDMIESYLADHILGRVRSTLSRQVLQQVIEEFDGARSRLMQIVEERTAPVIFVPGIPCPSSTNPMVGLDKDLEDLKDLLTGHVAERKVIPIVGMGGVGKTFLAMSLYYDSLIIKSFDIRAWVTISHNYDWHTTLLGILCCMSGHVVTDEIREMNNDKLGESLHKSLFGRRYLIILDDVWDTDVWDEINRFFPDNGEKSRIILTTRELSVANYVNSTSLHQMRLLNEVDSWSLLSSKVFGKEDCPHELKMIGEKIARNCKGLPLAIHVIGGLLSKTRKTQDLWTLVLNDVNSAAAHQDDELYSRILSLSYDHLPHHLRPCFLYIAAFPEDFPLILASKLIRLLVAEGFLKPIRDKTWEEVAEIYLKDLVDRNLLWVPEPEQESSMRVKSYIIHNLLRDLCVRKAGHEKFFHIIKLIEEGFSRKNQLDSIYRARISLREKTFRDHIRIPRHLLEVKATRDFVDNARYSLYIYSKPQWRFKFNFGDASRLLRELDMSEIDLNVFPKEIFQLVNLRYLAVMDNRGLSSEISKLWNLQTLIWKVTSARGRLVIPSELWTLKELRHIKLKNRKDDVFLSGIKDMGKWFKGKNESHHHITHVLDNLQTLSNVSASCYSGRDFLEKVPNLKKLGLYCENDGFMDLSCLHKLQTLKCSSHLLRWRPFNINCTFPPLIKKLTLRGFKLPVGFMATVGSLSNLQVLKLQKCHIIEEEWEPTDGEFVSLQYLLLDDLNLKNWRADDTHFPVLQKLFILGCSDLIEIPSGIGEINTLKIIQLYKSSSSAVDSARRIQEEQRGMGNNELQILF